MFDKQEKKSDSKEYGAIGGQLSPPAISLPKGGGAIRGIDEKFSVNPATGTSSLTVSVFTTPGRSDFYPKLSLSYDSGAEDLIPSLKPVRPGNVGEEIYDDEGNARLQHYITTCKPMSLIAYSTFTTDDRGLKKAA